MMALLAQAVDRGHILRQVSRHLREEGTGHSPALLLAMMAVALLPAGLYWAWRRYRRNVLEPGSRDLLQRLAAPLGLTARQQRLLRRLARAAGLEPAVGLLSPQLLHEMARRGQDAGLRLSASQARTLAQIAGAIRRTPQNRPA